MTQSRVRFAILGFGHHAVRRLLPAFSKCERGDAERDVAAGSGGCREELREVQDSALLSYARGAVFFA